MQIKKTQPTYYTYEIRKNVLDNITKYDWAKQQQKEAVEQAQYWLDNYETLYERITAEGIPRGRQLGRQNDPDHICCRYCGSDIVVKYGGSGVGGWVTDIIGHPWKVQCPDCKRRFPSNDFGRFYELGLNKKREFDRIRALEAHRELYGDKTLTSPGEEHSEQWHRYYGYGVKGGCLTNDLYPEIIESGHAPKASGTPGCGHEVDGTIWGVDDGFGYYPGRIYENGVIEHHGYIALYNHELCNETVLVLDRLNAAYIMTGDIKYGRAGAILLDRVADVYPDFNCLPYNNVFFNSGGGSAYGVMNGRISDANYALRYSKAADSFYPALGDSQVIEFLSKKAEEYGLENKKRSAEEIWQNWLNNLIRNILRNAEIGNVKGNFGYAQGAVAMTAVAAGTEPYTSEMLAWVYKTGESHGNSTHGGGNIDRQLLEVVDRDGFGNEGSPAYNSGWPSMIFDVFESIYRYSQKYPVNDRYNLIKNPRYLKMLTAFTHIPLISHNQPNIGDCGSIASTGQNGTMDAYRRYFKYLKDTDCAEELANYIYQRNNFKTDGLRYDIYTENPESMADDIAKLVDKSAPQKSELLSAYGFAVLRDGVQATEDTPEPEVSNLRDFWIYFGQNSG
nr:hypothetical protein [Clostridia bacterium]